MALLKEQEQICRDLGNVRDLALALRNQAAILQRRGDFDGALNLLKEEEEIYHEIGNFKSLVISLIDQAKLLSKQSRHQEALSAAEEAYRQASDHGYTSLNKQILQILENIRKGK